MSNPTRKSEVEALELAINQDIADSPLVVGVSWNGNHLEDGDFVDLSPYVSVKRRDSTLLRLDLTKRSLLPDENLSLKLKFNDKKLAPGKAYRLPKDGGKITIGDNVITLRVVLVTEAQL